MLRNIPSAALKELVKLTERKEALLARIQEIDREMVRVQRRFGIPSRDENQGGMVTISGSPQATSHRQTGRGVLKKKIMRALRSAGRKGVTIQGLAKKLHVPSANLYVWFNETGKNVRGLRKIGTAKYRLT